MNKSKNAFIFPGQGAQYVGMGKDFYEQFPLARQTFEEADDYLRFSLSQLIFSGQDSELTQTKNSQVAIYVTSVAIWRVVQKEYPELKPAACAGLSLGEYTALTAAGNLSFSDGIALVRRRGELMHEVSLTNSGTMAAILGLDEVAISQAIEEMQLEKEVWVANLNCPGQVVISGVKESVLMAMPALKERGARRAIELDVSGAFHSGLMKQAEDGLSQSIAVTPFHESEILVSMNVTGDFANSLSQMRINLIRQLTAPVRWQQSIETMVATNIEAFYEMGPGKTLQGMNRKIGIKQPTLSLETVKDLDKLKELACSY